MSDLGWAKSDGGSSSAADSASRSAGVSARQGVEHDRRTQNRREIDPRRAFAPLERVRDSHDWYPGYWPWVIGGAIASIVGCFVSSARLPDPIIMLALVLSVAGLSGTSRLHHFATDPSKPRRLIAIVGGIIGPVALYGYAVSAWAGDGNLSPGVAIAALCNVSIIAGIYLRRHVGVMLAMMVACWCWLAIGSGSLAAAFVGLAGLAFASITATDLLRGEAHEREVRESRNRSLARARGILADFEDSGQGWFWETDRRGLLTYISSPAAHLIGHRADKLIGQPFIQLFDLAQTLDEDEQTLLTAFEAIDAFHDIHVRAAASSMAEYWWSISGRPVFDDNSQFVGYRGSGTDLTERKRSQADAVRLARYDSLTGLANRSQMNRQLEEILYADKPERRVCSVMLLDLDRFKQVNDTMGHPAGDELLKQVAERLQDAVGRRGHVGRLGGDEFEVILPALSDQATLAQLAGSIIENVSRPYTIEEQRVVIGVSIGIARAPEDGGNTDDLIRNADLALYAAKDAGRGRYHFYAGDLHEAAEDRVQLEKDLRDAIEHGELRLFYQPVVSTASESITGFEALLRWKHAERGWIPPSRFIERAEDTGLIDEIGEWVLRTACRDLANWPEHIRVSVNVSPLQFANAQFPVVVASAIRDAGIESSRLELEITESVFLAENQSVDATFRDLKRLGVRMALDDFGTGYSSLGYLKRAPFDKIKIDRSFLNGATEKDSPNGAIIAAITSLAHTLSMETAAEGVETIEELDLVRMHGCSHVQGFIYEHPLDVDTASERLRTGLAPVKQGERPVRAPRRSTVRKVLLAHNGQKYEGTIRNISPTGALIEGLWNVPVGTQFTITLPDKRGVNAVTRWCAENRIGVEFVQLAEVRPTVSMSELSPERAAALERLRKAG